MTGIVIVSHSARLAEGVMELAKQVGGDKVPVAAAGGTGDAANALGTDAFRVLAAIESVASADAVLVLMDLGSAVLSAETALEFLDPSRRARVRLCPGPLVEGAVAAASLAAAGAGIEEVAAEAGRALTAKSNSLPAAVEGVEGRAVELKNALGLHARPAARLIRLVKQFDARVTLRNLSGQRGPADAASLSGILSLRGRQSDRIEIRAVGTQAREAIAAVAGFVESGCGDTEEPAFSSGTGASPGVAIGPLVRFGTSAIEVPARVAEDAGAEWERLQAAITAEAGHEKRSPLLQVQSLFLEDPALLEEARRLIFDQHMDAAFAWQCATKAVTEQFDTRVADLTDVASRVLVRMTGAAESQPSISQPSIVAARDLLPSQVEKLDPSLVLGLCLEGGNATAHSMILARARGIPAVAGLGPALATIAEGATIAIDGERGKLWISPGEDEIRIIQQLREQWLATRQAARVHRSRAAITRDGGRITILANLNREDQVFEALDSGAEGVGVLRTEFLFLDRDKPPTEEEQYNSYRNIAEALDGRPLVIRMLDIGGDKSVPYLDIGEESNPFLGWRGVRITLDRRDLFETQLRAILRAGQDYRVEALLPMISTVAELSAAKCIMRGLGADIPMGVMIEVPSAAVIADRLAGEVSRLSLGTNDLVQYLMAADRTNARVARMADHFDPAVLRMIRDVTEAGRRAGVRVDVCGEMAADPLATPLLLGLGVEEFSVSPPFIPELKAGVTRWDLAEARALAQQALTLDSADAVRRLVAQA